MPRRPKDKGTDAERLTVRWLQANGWPSAERRATRGLLDAGDITGTPGICWEVKTRSKPISDKQVNAWLAETEQERVNAGAEIGILVVRRPHANVRAWWAIITADVLTRLIAVEGINGEVEVHPHTPRPPVRLLLADLAALLRDYGYGTTDSESEAVSA